MPIGKMHLIGALPYNAFPLATAYAQFSDQERAMTCWEVDETRLPVPHENLSDVEHGMSQSPQTHGHMLIPSVDSENEWWHEIEVSLEHRIDGLHCEGWIDVAWTKVDDTHDGLATEGPVKPL